MIPLLEPLFQGELAPLGERLQHADTPPADAVRVADLLRSTDMLAEVLQRHARFRKSTGHDLRPVASAWCLEYVAALLPPVAAAASVLQHVFPMAAEQVWVRLDGDGAPTSFHIRETGQALYGTSTAQRYAPLLRQHLRPLFATLCSLTRVAPKILWGNAARQLDPILAQALALTGGAAVIAQDQAHLLHSPEWPRDAGDPPEPNPLFGRQREVHRIDGDECVAIKLHRQCCLYYLLPEEGYCGACPLAPQHRKGGVEVGEADT